MWFNDKKNENDVLNEMPDPAEFPLGSPESRAAARLRAEKVATECDCLSVVVTQLPSLNPNGQPDVLKLRVCEHHRQSQR